MRLDPNYALAYAKLSQAWRQYACQLCHRRCPKAYEEARRAAEKAVNLAPDLVEVRKAIGLLALTPDLDFRAAEKEFRHVLESSPNHAGAKSASRRYSLSAQGRLAEAEQTCREAVSLDPLVTVLWYNIGRVVVWIAVGTRKRRKCFAKDLRFSRTLRVFIVTSPRWISCRTHRQQAMQGPTGDRRFLARICDRFGAANAGRPSCGRCCAQGFHRQDIRKAAHFRSLCSTLFARSPTKCSSGSKPPMPRTIPV